MHGILKGGIMKGKFLLIVLAALLVVALLAPLSWTHSSADIVAGSSLIAGIAQDIADGKLEIHNLVPPGMCPGHYDVKPSDVETLANSKALIIHNWQQKMKNITGLIDAADNPDLIIKVIDVADAPMVPEVQSETVGKIAQALGEIDPENSAYYQQRAKGKMQAALAKGEEIKKQIAGGEGRRSKSNLLRYANTICKVGWL
jgi:zinc transport system substrate-binding protein